MNGVAHRGQKGAPNFLVQELEMVGCEPHKLGTGI